MLQCYAGFVSSGFPSEIAKAKIWQQETKVNYSLFPFLCLLSPYSARLCAPCEVTLRSFPSVPLRIPTAHNSTRHERARIKNGGFSLQLNLTMKVNRDFLENLYGDLSFFSVVLN